MLRNVAELVAYAWRQKVTVPQRWRRWKSLREPFVHTGENGLRFKLYPPELIDGYIYADGVYERRLLQFLSRRFSGRTMLDVGANIGNHALYLAQNFQTIHCFEPNPITVARLRDNVALNGLEGKIEIHPVGMGDRQASLPYRSNTTGNLGGGSFVGEWFPVSDVLPVVRGDDYIESNRIRDVDFIKVDVEGSEPCVLGGLKKTIERDRPVIIFEYDGRHFSFEEIRKHLSCYYFVEPVKKNRIFSIDRDPSSIGEPEPRYYEAILALPQERHLAPP